MTSEEQQEAKDKAKEIIDKFRNEFKWVERDYSIDLYRDTRQCALITVEYILLDKKILGDNYKFEYLRSIKFWEHVKEEIIKL